MKKADLILVQKILVEAMEKDDTRLIFKALNYVSVKLSEEIFPVSDLTAPFVAVALENYQKAIEKGMDEDSKLFADWLKKNSNQTTFSNRPPTEMEGEQ